MAWNRRSLPKYIESAANDCINASKDVSDTVFFDNSNGKWSIAENMIHLMAIAKRIASALALPKEQLAANFGLATKPSATYQKVTVRYSEALKGRVVVPKAFVAAQTADDTRTSVVDTYWQQHAQLVANIALFSETDLDTYQMPHPLLGLMTIREMLYFVVFHIAHHQKAIDRIVNG